MRHIALAAALAGTLAVLTPALAGDDDRMRLGVPAAEWKSVDEIKSQLTAAGYTVREIEADDGAYEVEATDKDGVRQEFHVHPKTGEILRGYDD
jgi:hypothetical protein